MIVRVILRVRVRVRVRVRGASLGRGWRGTEVDEVTKRRLILRVGSVGWRRAG